MCRSFSVKVDNLDGSNYVCRVAGLWGSIVPSKCYHKVCVILMKSYVKSYDIYVFSVLTNSAHM